MRRYVVLVGVVTMLSACASTSSVAIKSAADVEPATRAGIIEALGDGLYGAVVGDQSTRTDRIMALEAEYRALEHTPAGQTVSWRSQRSDLSGEVVAAQPYRVGSQDCRTYTHSVTTNGDARSARGTACRSADGSWTPLS